MTNVKDKKKNEVIDDDSAKIEKDEKNKVSAGEMVLERVIETSKKVEEMNNKYLDSNEDVVLVEKVSEKDKDMETSGVVVEKEEEEEVQDRVDDVKVDVVLDTGTDDNEKEEEEEKSILDDGAELIEINDDTEEDAGIAERSETVDEKAIATEDDVSTQVEEEAETMELAEEVNEDSRSSSPSTESQTKALPKGNRWAISAPGVDLSGVWKIVIDDKFKEDYDNYLKNLGQAALVRSIAVNIVELTTEEVVQDDHGRSLMIKGKNLRGVWERTLIASGADYENGFDEDKQEHDAIELVTADKENVMAEAWWEEEGTVHRSYLKGVKKYGGGNFESRRYLEDDGETLICESVFHPNEGGGKEPAVIKWKFTRAS